MPESPTLDLKELREALVRADGLIDAMSGYIGKMAVPAEFFANINQHWLFMERHRRALQPQEPGQ